MAGELGGVLVADEEKGVRALLQRTLEEASYDVITAANVASGQELYSQTCRRCHGFDGKRINFGSGEEPEYVGTLASDNPWETLHKIRFGNPGTNMPSAVADGWSIQDAVDVLGYAQTLPK